MEKEKVWLVEIRIAIIVCTVQAAKRLNIFTEEEEGLESRENREKKKAKRSRELER